MGGSNSNIAFSADRSGAEFTFGGVIRDWAFTRSGVENEVASLAIGMAIGLMLGVAFILWINRYNPPAWPLEEMVSWGHPHAFLISSHVAVPSGIGIALSVLSGNAGFLVGMAISASFLPPAVNCRLLWPVAAVIVATLDDRYLLGGFQMTVWRPTRRFRRQVIFWDQRAYSNSSKVEEEGGDEVGRRRSKTVSGQKQQSFISLAVKIYLSFFVLM